MNDDAAYLLACHILRAVCIEKGLNCDDFCMIPHYNRQPCDEWVNKKSITELLEKEKGKK